MTDTPTHHPTADATRERIALDPEAMRAAYKAHQHSLATCGAVSCQSDHLEAAVAGYLAALTPPTPPAEGDKEDGELIEELRLASISSFNIEERGKYLEVRRIQAELKEARAALSTRLSTLRSDLAAALSREADARAEIERLREANKVAAWNAKNEAFAEVFKAARRVYAHEGNDISDRQAVMTFAERYQPAALLADQAALRSAPKEG